MLLVGAEEEAGADDEESSSWALELVVALKI